ncbi:dTDP-4-dehydrorhamnose reductase [BD1-7 clade bacterium]|uniref:dTDP-4-dehydrorhamnose reductase n=1 Tax=BD1-7 clade bacterium TaxID=2029982 RepID=A0A5S9MSI7_9GAMM|nr:dTDP-4-dehydrorhamnose reductase [BD1-7 clade bacterium]
MKTKVLITGANGQLGCEFRYLDAIDHALCKDVEFLFVSRSELDITDRAAIESICDSEAINVIVNCAAYTAVDKAEEEPEEADAINHIAVGFLAETAKSRGIKLIHISTDYVFDGESANPYVESDIPNPINEYGKSKLAGEQVIRAIAPPDSIIVRTSWVYSSFGNNFVKTMLRLGRERDEIRVVSDQYGSPTNARDLAKVICDLLDRSIQNSPEVLHFSNSEACSWFEFASYILKSCDVKILPITTAQYVQKAARPQGTTMNTKKLELFLGGDPRSWTVALDDVLYELS